MKTPALLSIVLFLVACNSGAKVQYEGKSITEMMQSPGGERLQYVDQAYASEEWVNKHLPAGEYRLQENELPPLTVLASILLEGGRGILPELQDNLHCDQQKIPDTVGIYWSGDTLFIDKDYCNVKGGGIYEAKL